jgi:hypothetical protein
MIGLTQYSARLLGCSPLSAFRFGGKTSRWGYVIGWRGETRPRFSGDKEGHG